MPKALFIKLKRKIRGFDPDEESDCLDHSAVGKGLKHLDFLANAQRWATLSSFISEDPDAALDLLDEEDEEEAEAIIAKLGKVRWFPAKDALATLDIMIPAIEEMPRRIGPDIRKAPRIVRELKDLQAILKRAAEKEVPFRFYAEFG